MTNQPPERHPPGWYPDPELVDTVRYWDGQAWTEHRAPAGQSNPPTEAPASADSTTEKKPDKTAQGCGLGCLGLIVVFAIVWGLSSLGGDDGGQDDGGGEFGARDVCEQFVEDRLKAPSTADFSDTSATETGSEAWTVQGSVDSENGFGAMIRNTYVCQVRHTSGDNWHLVDLSLSGR
jgi:hypothetical protein